MTATPAPRGEPGGSSRLAPAQAFPAVGTSDGHARDCRACGGLGDPSAVGRRCGPACACPRVSPPAPSGSPPRLGPRPFPWARGPSAVRPPRQRPRAPSHRAAAGTGPPGPVTAATRPRAHRGRARFLRAVPLGHRLDANFTNACESLPRGPAASRRRRRPQPPTAGPLLPPREFARAAQTHEVVFVTLGGWKSTIKVQGLVPTPQASLLTCGHRLLRCPHAASSARAHPWRLSEPTPSALGRQPHGVGTHPEGLVLTPWRRPMALPPEAVAV